MASLSTVGDPAARESIDNTAWSLPSRYYTDEKIHTQELERIFHRSWIFAGYRSQFAQTGDYVTAQAGAESVIVVRASGGELKGFYNVCRHRAHQLLQGAGHVKDITCPYHAWRYTTDGELKFARNSDKVPGFDKRDFCLREVRVEDFCGFVFVNLDREAVPLIEQVPGLAKEFEVYEPRLDECRLVYRQSFTIQSNWKNVIDNYNENYHTPKVHPLLASILDDSYRILLKGKYLRHESDANPGKEGGFRVTGNQYPKHITWWLWPSLCPMSIPGGGFRVLHIIPDGPGRTRETYDFYLPYAQPDEAQWQQIHFALDVINTEDIGVVESIQKGLSSRSFEHSYIMMDPERGAWSEHAIAHLKSLVLEALHGQHG